LVGKIEKFRSKKVVRKFSSRNFRIRYFSTPSARVKSPPMVDHAWRPWATKTRRANRGLCLASDQILAMCSSKPTRSEMVKPIAWQSRGPSQYQGWEEGGQGVNLFLGCLWIISNLKLGLLMAPHVEVGLLWWSAESVPPMQESEMKEQLPSAHLATTMSWLISRAFLCGYAWVRRTWKWKWQKYSLYVSIVLVW